MGDATANAQRQRARSAIGYGRRRGALEAPPGVRNGTDYRLVLGGDTFLKKKSSPGQRGVEMPDAGGERCRRDGRRAAVFLVEPGSAGDLHRKMDGRISWRPEARVPPAGVPAGRGRHHTTEGNPYQYKCDRRGKERKGSRAQGGASGDKIFVSGTLGEADLGLQLVRS